MEKFFDIKCRASGEIPNCIVLVATIRALKMHGGGPTVTSGGALAAEYTNENLELLEKGLPNLYRHIENGKKFGVPVVVAVNTFSTDTPAEVELVKKAAKTAGAFDAIFCNHWAEGGTGALELAEAVEKASQQAVNFKLLYPLEGMGIMEKIEHIAKEMYGAGKVEANEHVLTMIKKYQEQGLGSLPICMSKTSMSLTGDAAIKGAPVGFTLQLTDIFVSAGAGFIVPMVGEVSCQLL